MKQKINNLNLQREKLGFLLLSLIILSLALYILLLNLAVSEGFRREGLEKKNKILRQGVISREEFFISRLSEFYDQNATSFAAIGESEPKFASRRPDVARAPGALLR